MRQAAACSEDAEQLLSGLDEAEERLGATLAAQGKSLTGQHEDVEAQRRQLRVLAEAQPRWWEGLAFAADRWVRDMHDIVAAVSARYGGMLDATSQGHRAQLDLRMALDSHSAAQEALFMNLRNNTHELQVGVYLDQPLNYAVDSLICVGLVGSRVRWATIVGHAFTELSSKNVQAHVTFEQAELLQQARELDWCSHQNKAVAASLRDRHGMVVANITANFESLRREVRSFGKAYRALV